MTFSSGTTSFAALAGSFLLCGVTAMAQTQPQAQQTQPQAQPSQTGINSPRNPNSDNIAPAASGQTTPEDTVFVKDALEGGMAEVQLGNLALQKSNNSDVKAFAQKMVDDHTKMGDQMKTLAQQVGVKVPTDVSKKDRATIAKMSALSGDDFDKAYMKDMVKDHKTDLSDFQIEAQNGSNPVVKSAATQGAQMISQHLQMAQQITQKTGTMALK
jgi:putative membrane protein